MAQQLDFSTPEWLINAKAPSRVIPVQKVKYQQVQQKKPVSKVTVNPFTAKPVQKVVEKPVVSTPKVQVPANLGTSTVVNPGPVGGKFIPTDIEQVKEFQRSIGVKDDGKIGNITRAAAAKKGFTIAPSKFDYKGKSGGKQPTEKPVVMKDKEGLAYNLVGQDRRPGKDEELPAGMVLDKNGNAQMVYNPANSDYARTVQATKEATLQNQIERDAYNKMYGAGGSPMESGYEPEDTGYAAWKEDQARRAAAEPAAIAARQQELQGYDVNPMSSDFDAGLFKKNAIKYNMAATSQTPSYGW